MTLADARAALERGRAVVLVCPPAPERARGVWELLGSPPLEPAGTPHGVIICSDDEAAGAWAGIAPPDRRVHAVTGLTRSAALLKAGSVQVLAGAPKDLAALAQRAALKLASVSTVLVAWPEGLIAGDHAPTLDTLLGEAREARRIVLSWNPTLLGDFLERHARRALMVGTPPVDDTGASLPPVCRARYAVVASPHAAAHHALDVLHAAAPFVWEGGSGPISPPVSHPDAVLCTALPSREELGALARFGDPVLLIRAAQLPYLRSIATLTPFSLPSGADRARDRVEALRERIGVRLSEGNVDAELALLDPLFERFDPAEVAGALFALQRDTGNGIQDAMVGEPDAERIKVFVNIGKKDRVGAKDLVGALIREVGLAKGDIGRIEVRESFSLVEVPPVVAERAVRGLSGVTIRGRRVVARLDRDRQ